VPGPPTSAVSIVEGEVTGVSGDGYTATVQLRDGRRPTVQVASPQLTIGSHTDTGGYGAGMNLGPVAGSPCLVLTTSMGQSYLFAYYNPYGTTVTSEGSTSQPVSKGGYQGNRSPLQQGDMRLNTRAGSFVDILASGIAQIGASDIAKTIYLPKDESARTICKNFLVATGLGNMAWSFDDTTKKGSFRILSRSGSAPDSPSGALSLGDSPNGNLVELFTSSGGKASIAIDQKGNIRGDSNKDITLRAKEGVIRQDARKIYLNSGSSFGPKAFVSNFYALPALALPPGSPSAIFQFPKPIALPTSLRIPDPKRILSLPKFAVPSISLPKAPLDALGAGSSGDDGVGRPP